LENRGKYDFAGLDISLAMNVHRALGQGFEECVYANALALERSKAGISFRTEEPLLNVPVPNPVHSVHSVKATSAFSLIEVVLALGVISFAVVGIMGLIPTAMRTAQESQRETRATLIARQIFSDLQAGTNATRHIGIRPGITNAANVVSLSLTNSSINGIYFDMDGLPVGQSKTPDSIYSATVTVTPNVPTAGLSHIETVVATPAPAPTNAAGRSTYTFVTLLRQD